MSKEGREGCKEGVGYRVVVVRTAEKLRYQMTYERNGRTRAYEVVAVEFANLKNNVVSCPAIPSVRLKFSREMFARPLSEDRTPIEELNKKESSHSCEHDIIFPEGVALLGGIYLGVECKVVRAKVLRPIFLPYIIRLGLGR